MMARPKWLVPKGSNTQASAFTSEPGEKIYYTPGLKPEQARVEPIPEYVHQTIEHTLRDMEDLSAQREVSQARVPGGVRSGVAIAQLPGAGRFDPHPGDHECEAQPRRGGHHGARAHEPERRVLAHGEGYGQEQRDRDVDLHRPGHGRGEQLEDRGHLLRRRGTDGLGAAAVQGVAHRLHPRPRSLRRVQHRGPEGEAPGPRDAAAWCSEEPGIAEATLDRDAVYRENMALDQGMLLQINNWDNDEEHISGHRRRQKEADFMRLE